MTSHLPDIGIASIPHKYQRYDTAGDYWETEHGGWRLRVSQLPDWRMEAALLIHEMVEMFLAKARGIDWKTIDDFDITHLELDEPGDDRRAPYHREHRFATKIEKLLAKELGFNWTAYQHALDEVTYGPDTPHAAPEAPVL